MTEKYIHLGEVSDHANRRFRLRKSFKYGGEIIAEGSEYIFSFENPNTIMFHRVGYPCGVGFNVFTLDEILSRPEWFEEILAEEKVVTELQEMPREEFERLQIEWMPPMVMAFDGVRWYTYAYRPEPKTYTDQSIFDLSSMD